MMSTHPRTRIVCFGEALIDFLNTGVAREGELALNQFTQFPGGAPANVAVAAAKLGVETRFLGQVGQDTFGDFLLQSLARYGVDTSQTLRHPTAKTALAFVFLDGDGDRSFEFYRDQTADLLLCKTQLQPDQFDGCGLFHFCSNTLTTDTSADTTAAALAMARAVGAVVSFDVNLRHNLWQKGTADRDRVNIFVREAEVLKFSREELEYLAEGDSEGYLQGLLAARSRLILVTDGGAPVSVYTALGHFTVEIPPVNVVDTTAGGDGFSGGLLRVIATCGLDTLLDDSDRLQQGVAFAVRCGAIAVSRAGAFPALPTLEEVQNLEVTA